jgi:hypothetical protein
MIKSNSYSFYNKKINKYLDKVDNELINSLAVVSPINKNFFLNNKKFFLEIENFFFLKFLISTFKLIIRLFIYLIFKKKKNKKKSKKILFLSHSNLINKRKIDDVYFNQIISSFKIPNSKYLIKFYPQSNKFIINNNNFFNGNNINFIDEIKIIFKLLYTAYAELANNFFNLDNFSKKIILDLLSGNTYKNLRIAFEIKNFIKVNSIKKIFITSEGHSYEKLICYFLKKYLPEIKIYGYQTTCLSRNQSFLFNSKKEYLPHKILLSRKSDINFFNSKNNLLFKPIYLGKLKRTKNKINKWKLLKPKKIYKILILIDRYHDKDLEQIISFSKKIIKNKNYKIIFRAHPILNLFFLNIFNKNKLGEINNFSIDNSTSFKKLFFENDIIIYSQSSFFLHSIKFGIFPIYFKYNSENFEDIFKEIKKPILNSPAKLQYITNNFKKINKIYKFKNYLISEKNFLINKDIKLKNIFS